MHLFGQPRRRPVPTCRKRILGFSRWRPGRPYRTSLRHVDPKIGFGLPRMGGIAAERSAYGTGGIGGSRRRAGSACAAAAAPVAVLEPNDVVEFSS